MESEKPELPYGYLGAQDQFKEFGISTLSHHDPEITIRDCFLEIKLQLASPVKFTHQLIECKTENSLGLSNYVFIHTKEGIAHIVVHIPKAGYYKLQLFALPLKEPSNSLPNVFNYLIRCTKTLQDAHTFPKQYTQWKDGCFINEPLCIYKDMPTIKHVHWSVHVPHAKAVALIVGDEWYHFEHRGGPVFEAKVGLQDAVGKKITLNANFESDEEKYCTLLEYKL